MAGSTIIQLVLRARDEMSNALNGAAGKVAGLIAAFAGASAIKEAPEQTYVVQGINDQPFPPGHLRINGGEAGEIHGPAILIWRSRSGVGQEVAFYGDDISQVSAATYEITVLHGANQVWQQSVVVGESWEFTGERNANGGLLFDQLTFKIMATQVGFTSSVPLEISVSRSSVA